MTLRNLVAIAALTLTPALALADGAPPDYSGVMTITYHPIMCVVPPCPPGRYTIEIEGERVADGDVIAIESATDTNQYRGMYLNIETVTADLWIGGDDKVDYTGTGLPEGLLLVRLSGDQ